MYSAIQSHSFLDERYYTARLKNGIEVIVYPKKDMPSTSFSVSFNFGSGISMVKDIEKDETTIIPPGTAHFLEHMMFYDGNGDSFLKIFDGLNIYSNGYTGEKYTYYSIDVLDKDFEKPFSLLLSMVFDKPYFSDEAFENERNIILQEAAEEKTHYKNICGKLIDMAYGKSKVYNGIKNNIGTKEDLFMVSKELLYKCYELFYHPENSLITILGDVDVNEIIAFLEDYFDNMTFLSPKNLSFEFDVSDNEIRDEINVYDYIEKIMNEINKVESDSSNIIVEGNDFVQSGILFRFDDTELKPIDIICINIK